MVHYQQIRDAWGGLRIRPAKSPGIPGCRCAERHIGVRRAGLDLPHLPRLVAVCGGLLASRRPRRRPKAEHQLFGCI